MSRIIRLEGAPPYHMILDNFRGADFVYRYSVPDTVVIPAGTTTRLELYNPDGTILVTLTGSQVGTGWDFRAESVDADNWPSKVHYRGYIRFPGTPTLDLPLMFGDIIRIG